MGLLTRPNSISSYLVIFFDKAHVRKAGRMRGCTRAHLRTGSEVKTTPAENMFLLQRSPGDKNNIPYNKKIGRKEDGHLGTEVPKGSPHLILRGITQGPASLVTFPTIVKIHS